MKQVLLIAGGGTLGTHTARELLRLGHRVDILCPEDKTSCHEALTYHKGLGDADTLTKLFAARLAEYGVSVIEIRPGIIETDMTSKVKEKYEALIADGITPIKRMGTPEDIGKCVSSIAKGSFDFCTGTVIDCDGGFNVRSL